MKFFITIYNLSVMEVIILNIFLLLINIVCSLSIGDLVRDNFNKTKSADTALYLEHKLYKYFYLIILTLGTALSTTSLLPHFEFLGEFGFLCVLIIVFLIFFMEIILFNLIIYNINKNIRATSSGRLKRIKCLLKELILSIMPIIIIFAAAAIKPFNFLGNIIFAALLIIIFFLLMSLIFKKSSKISDAEDEDLLSFIMESEAKGVKLKVMKAADNKIANAFAKGLFKKEIIVTDYLLQNLAIDEVKSILAHEIGHIIMKHPLKRFIMIILFSVFYILSIYFQEYIGLYIILIWIFMFIFTAFLSQYINRSQERKADEYVSSLGIDKFVYANALIKLHHLNNTVIKFNKFDEKLQTHPSAIGRIKYILGDDFQNFISEHWS